MSKKKKPRRRRKYTPRPPRPINPKRLVFRRMYQSRVFTLRLIALHLGVAVSTLNYWRRSDFPNGSKWLWLEFVRLYELNHYGTGDLATALGCHRQTVLRFIVRYRSRYPIRAAQIEATAPHYANNPRGRKSKATPHAPGRPTGYPAPVEDLVPGGGGTGAGGFARSSPPSPEEDLPRPRRLDGTRAPAEDLPPGFGSSSSGISETTEDASGIK